MSILGSVGALLGGGKQKQSSGDKAAEQYYKELARIAAAQRDGPGRASGNVYAALQDGRGNPLYDQVFDTERQNYVNNAYDFLNQMAIQNRRAVARGAPSSIINPERRDEMFARTMAAKHATADTFARDQAQKYLGELMGQAGNWSSTLSGAGASFGNAGTGMTNVGQTQRGIANANNERGATIGRTIGDIGDYWLGNTGSGQRTAQAIGNLFM
jgi:hypothetical protein